MLASITELEDSLSKISAALPSYKVPSTYFQCSHTSPLGDKIFFMPDSLGLFRGAGSGSFPPHPLSTIPSSLPQSQPSLFSYLRKIKRKETVILLSVLMVINSRFSSPSLLLNVS